MYIVFEGIDGTGKTQFSKDVAELIARERPQLDVQLRVEPSSGPIGSRIREIFERKHGDRLPSWKPMFLLFQADREATIEQVKEAKKHRGTVVVSDRSPLSSWVYQPLAARFEHPGEHEGGSLAGAEAFVEGLIRYLPAPDWLFILDGSIDEVLKRKQRELDLFEKRDNLEQARERYLKLPKCWAHLDINERVHVIDTNRDLEEVRQDIFNRIRRIL